MIGNRISHAHNVSRRRVAPEPARGAALRQRTDQRIKVCTRCLRSGKVVKSVN